ncbi:MAG: hypothetical protein ACLT4X_01640 [Phascolarctobacterium sp.]
MADYILGAVLVVLFILALVVTLVKSIAATVAAMVVVDVLMPNSAVWRVKEKVDKVGYKLYANTIAFDYSNLNC